MSLLGSAAAAVTFAFTLNPQYAAVAYSIGSSVDAFLNQPDRIGPRLDDLRTQMSVYGNPIPFEYGCNRHAGTVIWPQILEAVEHEHSESAKGGPEQKSFTYTMSLAVLVCEGPIAGIRRIWANKKLIYDVSVANEGATMDPAIGSIRFYTGTETQEVDPLIEATDGASPAYLGYAYVVFEDYDVTEMNGRPPQFEFEVMTSGSPSAGVPVNVGTGGVTAVYTDPDTGARTVHSVDQDFLYIYDGDTLELLQTLELPTVGKSITAGAANGVWVGHDQPGGINATFIKREEDGTFSVDSTTDFGYGGVISHLGTVAWNDAKGWLYGFVNNGVGSGAATWPTFVGSGIAVPHWTYHTLEMPDADRLAVAGLGNWIVLASLSADTAIGTIHNVDWAETLGHHRLQYDQLRALVYWACIGFDGVYSVDLDGTTLTKLIDVSSVGGMHYDPHTDRIYVDSGGDLLVYNTDGELEGTLVGYGVLDGQLLGNSVAYSDEYYFASEAGVLWQIPIGTRLNPNRVALSAIVADICARAGLESGDIDVTQLTDLVDGYIVPRQMTARAAIEPLQQAYYFDAVESDDKIKFVKRGSATTTTIPADDRAAHEPGQDMPASVEVLRAFETELPIQCDVEYPDIDADHQIGNQYDRRITKDTRHRVNLQLPIVMPAAKAKQVARATLYQAWQNNTFRWSTTRKYAHLEPTDIVALPTDSATYRARITNRRDQPNGIIEWEGAQESVEVYTQSGDDGVTPPYSSQTVFQASTTVLELLDTPILRDQDKDKGFYVAMCGTTSSWPGAEVFRSEDEGSTYGSVLVQSAKAAIGVASDALENFTGGNVFDEGNTVTIEMIGGATLTSYSETQVLNGYGIAALGAENRWEIIQYKTATLVSPNTYTLSGLLRGRRGTEWAMSLHQAGDTFVLGSETAWRLYEPPTRDLNQERLYKAPAYRTKLSEAAAVSFTDHAARRRPYSVANLKAEPLNDGGIYVSWAHRSLVGGEWLSGSDVSIDGAFNTFKVTVSTVDGNVVKNFTTTTEFLAYSLGQIEADFGGAPPVLKIRVAQNNSDYGDGVGVSIRTDNQTPYYDVSAPDSPPYEPPTPGDPNAGIDPENPVIPAGNTTSGNPWGAPCLWDGTRFIAPDVYQVVVEVAGKAWTSTDGLHYAQLAATNLPFACNLLSFDGTNYVAGARDSYGPKIWHSTDLQSWTEGVYGSYPSGAGTNDSGDKVRKIIYAEGRFVALREAGEIMSSDDGGATWSHKCCVNTPGVFYDVLKAPDSGVMHNCIGYGGGKYIVVGSYGSLWVAAAHDGPYTNIDFGFSEADTPYLFDVGYFDGNHYVVGGGRYYYPNGYFVEKPSVLRSADGVTWEDISPAPTLATQYYKSDGCRRIFQLDSGRIIVIGDNADYFSDDGGDTWTLSSRLDPNETGYDPETRVFKGYISRLLGGATNGDFVAARESYYRARTQASLSGTQSFYDTYDKPMIFDGDDYTPDLLTPYVP